MLDSHLLRATDSLAVSSAPRGRSAPRSSRATSDIDTVRTPTTLTRHRSTRFARSRCHPLPRRFAGGRGDDRGARTGGRLRPSTRPRARACEPRCHHSSAHNVTECERASVRLGSLLGGAFLDTHDRPVVDHPSARNGSIDIVGNLATEASGH